MTLVIANARAADGATVDLVARNGVVAALGPGAAATAEPEAERHDADGRLLLPGLVEGHVHLDKTLVGLPFIPHIPAAACANGSTRRNRSAAVSTCPSPRAAGD